jgi:hypothetical protein
MPAASGITHSFSQLVYISALLLPGVVLDSWHAVADKSDMVPDFVELSVMCSVRQSLAE